MAAVVSYRRIVPVIKCRFFIQCKTFSTLKPTKQVQQQKLLGPKWKLTWFAVIGLGAGGGIYYSTLSSSEKRKVRVLFGGIGRFLR